MASPDPKLFAELLEALTNLVGLAKGGVPLSQYGSAIRDAEALIAKASGQ